MSPVGRQKGGANEVAPGLVALPRGGTATTLAGHRKMVPQEVLPPRNTRGAGSSRDFVRSSPTDESARAAARPADRVELAAPPA